MAELAQCVLAWFETHPTNGGVVAVTHGSPVAALRSRLAGLPVPAWFGLVPAHGEAVHLPGWTGC